MHRSFSRLAVLLTTAVLAACAAAPSDVDRLMNRNDHGDDSAYSSTLRGGLDGETRRAQLLRASGDYKGAVHILSQLMLVAPDDPRVVGEYGKVLTQQGRAPEAVEFLKRAVELQPNDWTLYSALGVAYDQTGDAVGAQTAYQRALALNPHEAVVLNNYAMSRMLAGDLDLAHKLITQAAASADPKIAHNRALIEGLIGKPKPAQAAANQPTPVATSAPMPANSAPGASESPASHPPMPLAAQVKGQTVVMQSVPFDPKAGPVAKHPKARAAGAPASTKSAKRKPKNQIPSLRTAYDRP